MLLVDVCRQRSGTTHGCTQRNKLASQRVINKRGEVTWVSPHELFFGTKPDLSHVMAFGSQCRVLKTGPETTAAGKLQERTDRGTVLVWGGDGVQIGERSVRLILGHVVLMDDGRVVYTREVDVDESDLLAVGTSPFLPDRTSADQAAGQDSSVPTHLADIGGDTEADEEDNLSDSEAVVRPSGQPLEDFEDFEDSDVQQGDVANAPGDDEDLHPADDTALRPNDHGGRRGKRAIGSEELERAPQMPDLGFDPLRRDSA